MEQSMIIFFTLLAFLVGVIVGIVIHSLAAISNFNSALDDAYEIGYAKGVEEEMQKHVEWLEKTLDDGK